MSTESNKVIDRDGRVEKLSLLDLCKQKEEAGMARTDQWIAMWDESLRYFLSEQLDGKKEHKDWDNVVLNYIWPSIMQEMAKLSRDYRIIASGRESSDTEAAEAWQGFLQWQWEYGLETLPGGMTVGQLRAILDGKLYGYRVSKLFWDTRTRWNPDVFPPQWEGEVRHRLWRPQEFWASDKEFINEGDCGTVRYVSLDYAISQWPKFKKQLTDSSVGYPDTLSGGGEHIMGQTSSAGTYPSAGTGGPDKGPTTVSTSTLLDLVLSYDKATATDQTRYCRISETYLKDYTERKGSKEIVPERDALLQAGVIVPNGDSWSTPDGEPVTSENWPSKMVEWDEPIYPNGRMIIRNEDTILNPDEEDQVYKFSVWPFIVTPHYLLPHMWQGTDAVTLYRTTQDMINTTVSHLVNNMKMFGSPRIAVEQDAIATLGGRTKRRYKIFTGAGSIIRLVRGGLKRYKIENPVSPSAAATQLYGLFSQEYKNFVGLQDIATGRKTTGNTTATEAQFLAISSNDRIKLQNVLEESWVRQIISLAAEMDKYYYPIGRWLRVIGEDQKKGGLEITQGLKDLHFDADIEPGQSLPFDEEKQILKYEKAYAMLQNPVANPMLPEMLRVLGVSSWEKLLQKYEPWRLYYQLLKLYESVKKGEVLPQDAVQMIVQKATELYQQEQANTVPTQEGQKQ